MAWLLCHRIWCTYYYYKFAGETVMNRTKATFLLALTTAIAVTANVSLVAAQALDGGNGTLKNTAVNKAAVSKADASKAGTIAFAQQVSGPYSSGNLSVFLITGSDKSKNKEYLTLPEGMSKKQVVVQETGNVNILKIDNLSSAALFIQSGEIVKGGRQDRAIQSDMLIPPQTKGVNLPCFCVEHGRWSGRVGESAGQFDSASNFVVGNDMQRVIRKDADQGKVWAQVAVKQTQLARSVAQPVASDKSPSSLQLTLEQKSVMNATQRQFNDLSETVNKEKNAIGYAIAINGKISSADIYASGGLFKKLWPGLLKAAVIEAVAQKGAVATKPPSPSEIKTVLAQAEHYRPASFQPSLQGATSGVIGPQGNDACYVTGVNTAGTVRTTSPLDFFFRTTDTKSGAVVHENFLGK